MTMALILADSLTAICILVRRMQQERREDARKSIVTIIHAGNIWELFPAMIRVLHSLFKFLYSSSLSKEPHF